MDATLNKPDPQTVELLKKLDSKMDQVQGEINSLLDKHVELMSPVLDLGDKIRSKRAELSPIAQMKASLVNAKSRDKYFPDESKNSMKEKVKEYVN